MKRTAIYARYSSNSQSEQSIEGQLTVCMDYAKKHDLKIIETYIDRAITGTSDDRAAFQQMIRDGKLGKFEVLLVYKTDRFSRNKYDSAVYKNQLRKAGVQIRYAAEAIPDGPEGIIMESLMEGLAEYYSAELSQKIKRGIRESAMKCKSLGGNMPLGLTSDAEKNIVICEEQAVIVRKVFQLYIQGIDNSEICRQLNAMGYRTKRGKPFNKNSIPRMIRNEKYIGTYIQGEYRIANGIPAIIDHQTFSLAQAEADRRGDVRPRPGVRADYALSGKLFCGDCKAPMVGLSGCSKSKKPYHYYQCKEGRRGNGCKAKPVPKAKLEKAVVQATLEFVLQPEMISYIGRRCAELQRADTQKADELAALKVKLRECRKAQDNILRTIETGVVTRTLPERLQKLENEEAYIKSELRYLESAQKPDISAEQFEYMLYRFADPAPSEDLSKWHRRIIDAFVSKVWYYGNRIVIYYNLLGDGDQLRKNDIEIAACRQNEGVRLESGMVEPLMHEAEIIISPLGILLDVAAINGVLR